MRVFVSLLFAVLLGCVLAFAGAGQASGTSSSNNQQDPAKAPKTKYVACMKCNHASTKKGDCDTCKVTMVPIKARASWGCKECQLVAQKQGECKKCKKPHIRVVSTYHCESCHETSSKKVDKCEKCGKEVKRKILELKDPKV